MAQATAVEAALCMHDSWNKKPLPNDIIELKFFLPGSIFVKQRSFISKPSKQY
jgi:hypothetical protein